MCLVRTSSIIGATPWLCMASPLIIDYLRTEPHLVICECENDRTTVIYVIQNGVIQPLTFQNQSVIGPFSSIDGHKKKRQERSPPTLHSPHPPPCLLLSPLPPPSTLTPPQPCLRLSLLPPPLSPHPPPCLLLSPLPPPSTLTPPQPCLRLSPLAFSDLTDFLKLDIYEIFITVNVKTREEHVWSL